jgi:biopolymer transport protein TolR
MELSERCECLSLTGNRTARWEVIVKLTERSSYGPKGEINITPMIDILLVLLIIFMVISPTLSVGLDSRIPQPNSGPISPTVEPDKAIVIAIQADLSVRINQEPTPVHELEDRLRAILKSRTERSVFLQADSNLPFEAVANIIDTARSAGADRTGLLTAKLHPAKP